MLGKSRCLPDEEALPPADVSKPAVTHCQSGGRASVLAFTLELMGARDVRNYYKSWAEWGNADDTPVVRPPAKK